MKKCCLICSFLVLSCVFCVCGFSQVDKDVEKAAAEMSLKQKVGQLFMIGNLAEKLTSEEICSVYHFGNVFLGYDDINNLDAAQIAQLTAKLQALARKYNNIPLMIATDQEGGRVNRVKKGAVVYPDQEFVGSRLSPGQAEDLAMYTAQQLRAIGINTNFSPVVDVNTNTKSHIAKNKRSFSGKPEIVTEYALGYMKGYRKGNVIGCAKHFPGYGDVSPDPHKNLPSTAKTLEELETCELIPYEALIKSGNVDLIMTAHIMTPSVTGQEKLPATISAEIIQELLRNKMKYKGVIVTDDFNMGALSGIYSIEELSVMCINAGVDIILFVGRPEMQKRAWKGIFKAVEDGRISKKRLDESVLRILELKKKYGLYESENPSAVKKLYNTEEQKAFLDLIRQSSDKNR